MRVLVLGGTGTVGSQVTRELVSRGVDVEVLTRHPEKARMPAGARAVAGDLLDPTTVRSVFSGMDGVFLLNALGASEGNEGLMALVGAQMAGVGRIVYLSVHHVEDYCFLPHFGSKIAVEYALKQSGIPYTILRPDNFFQNDYWFKDALLQYGVYPQPIGTTGIWRVDVRDIGEAAAIAFTERGHEGEIFDLVGPESLTGPGVTEVWSQALGKPIVYGGEDMDAWEKQFAPYFPPYLLFDFRLMYETFQRRGMPSTPAVVARLTQLLGHPPRSFEEFARETAAAWKD